MIKVVNCSSVSPLINHSESPNCKAFRAVISNFPRIIYIAEQIHKDQQITYNYNDTKSNYATD
jgi:SET domain-containing protein